MSAEISVSSVGATKIAAWDDLLPEQPAYARVANVDLVIIRHGGNQGVSVMYGRCQHRGALLSDGTVRAGRLVCGLHGSTYDAETGTNIHYQGADLKKFDAWVEDGAVWVDEAEIARWENHHPQKYARDAYQGLYADFKGTPEEPHNGAIQRLAADGLTKVGHHGQVEAMGVPRADLPTWDDLQLVTAQLATPPLLDDAAVGTAVTIGPRAARPLRLEIPLFVSDMSYGALSEEAKTALASGADLAGTGICSGEGGVLPEEQAANSRYFYELASARFGYTLEKVTASQAFHFKLGQAAKTGTGGHLPGHKVKGKIARVRGLEEGTPAVSPARFPDLTSVDDYRRVAAEIREATGGIPIGVKMSAQHIERDLDAAVAIGFDYVILDGRGGGTGAAPLLFRDNISVPTIPALARARRHLDSIGVHDVTLIITGGLRTHADFIKALALGADAIAIANSAMQAIGCLGMRACHTNKCPVGIATQDPVLRNRLPVDEAAQRLARYLGATVELMQVMARACGHDHLSKFSHDDLVTWKRDVSALSGVAFGGVTAP
ncbi:glutamate synthase-related protein [Hoyosella altamirensis]|uniref:Glutamate synthase domain-containing protein 2/nitrite reductase/ring-hydroxylating ferredoxin subunit n=1 Tax=Hoyosella altamirensis TaxID=616997 RepID=A0A839RL14_9ACTN|nr:glutamate synthase-related protein [Hoyosella altamirensis]MBB3036854.1 glutamate synthase domain-containing protein 2/nitrite reductase/ring-hydroxylating ferredoxin subunit [Hoyosella altamirensis]